MGLSDVEVAAFEDYFYHIMAARGSGEHALRHLLAPFARAKHPLEGRLHDLKACSSRSFSCLPLGALDYCEAPYRKQYSRRVPLFHVCDMAVDEHR